MILNDPKEEYLPITNPNWGSPFIIVTSLAFWHQKSGIGLGRVQPELRAASRCQGLEKPRILGHLVLRRSQGHPYRIILPELQEERSKLGKTLDTVWNTFYQPYVLQCACAVMMHLQTTSVTNYFSTTCSCLLHIYIYIYTANAYAA